MAAKQLLQDQNDYPLPFARRAIRSLLFRAGLTRPLGQLRWKVVEQAPYIQTLSSRSVRMFDGMPTRFDDPQFDEMIGPDTARYSAQVESITAIDHCWVEPNRCLIIGPDGALVAQSIPHNLIPLFPSAIGYARRGAGTFLAEAYVHDGFASTNFYHHLAESVASLLLFQEQAGQPADIPVVVNRWIYESPFFADLRARSARFAAVNWRVQEANEWLRIGRAYRARALPFDPPRWREMRALYGQVSKPQGRRIFLSRDKARFSRGLHNEEAVSALLAKFGFETVYFEDLTPMQQQSLMEECEFLVALHGMALIQQLFMEPSKARILELMPASRLHSVYFWQAFTLGVCFYDAQAHSNLGADGHYDVDLARLEAGVQRMLRAPADRQTYGSTTVDRAATTA